MWLQYIINKDNENINGIPLDNKLNQNYYICHMKTDKIKESFCVNIDN